MQKYCLLPATLAVLAGFTAGCGMLEPDYETSEREALRQVGQGLGIARFAPQDANDSAGEEGSAGRAGSASYSHSLQTLPAADAPAEDYLRFALLNHPRVQGAFYLWWQQVEAITPARSLPDPMLTFQADITDMLMSLMPGLMFEIPGWGKLEAAGQEAAAGAQVAYQEYVLALHQTAAQVRMAWAQLHYSTQMVALGEESLVALGQSVAAAGAEYGTGSGMASLQMQAEQMNAKAKAAASLEDRRDDLVAARARFKSALGLRPADADPHWPTQAFPAEQTLSADELWERATAHNPRLAVMRAMAQMAVQQVQMAKTEGNPDFAIGLMADVKTNPVMFRPEAAVSLPIWRDKIAAILASAQAGELAAQASLSSEELELAAELAQTLAMLRRSERQLTYLQTHALPSVGRSRDSVDASYRSGVGDFGSLVTLRLMDVQMREEFEMATLEHAQALAELSLLAALPLPDEGLLASRSE